MSRFRARNAPSKEDGELQDSLNRASREVESALRIARKHRSDRGRDVGRQLDRILSSLAEVGNLVPRKVEDPDMIPESQRVLSFRERMSAERDARWSERRAKKKAARKAARAQSEVSGE